MIQNKSKESWDVIIEPTHNIFDLQLIKVWNYRDLLYLFVKRDIVAFYKQTILGPIWFFIQPLFTTVIYIFIFSNLASISTEGSPPAIFYLIGITAWNYYSECLTKTATVFKDNANIFGKVYFPRLIMPLSIVGSNLVKYLIQLVLVILLILFYEFKGVHFNASIYIFIFPLLLVLLAAQAIGFGMIISALTTKYRDLALLLNFAIQLLLYATTVAYPLSSLSGRTKLLVSLNPITYLIEGMRKGILGNGTFDFYNLIYSSIISFIILLCGLIIFNKVERNFIDTI